MKKLTTLQQNLCDIILLMELSGKVCQGRAYELAGYKSRGKTAQEEASRTLKKPQVKAYLAHARAQRAEKVEKTEDEIIKEYEKLAYSRLTDLVKFNNKGMVIKSSKDLSEKAKGALKSIKMREFTYKNKKGKKGKVVTITVDLHDKKGALDSLAKIKGLFIKSDSVVGQSFAQALHEAMKNGK
jgi:phage terminase small subunit